VGETFTVSHSFVGLSAPHDLVGSYGVTNQYNPYGGISLMLKTLVVNGAISSNANLKLFKRYALLSLVVRKIREASQTYSMWWDRVNLLEKLQYVLSLTSSCRRSTASILDPKRDLDL
jgi:hypothetical protein